MSDTKLTSAPEVVVGAGHVEHGPGLDERRRGEVFWADQSEEASSHGGQWAGGSVGRRQGVDVEDRHGQAT